MTELSPLSRPPIILVSTSHEWSARALDAALGPRGFTVLRAHHSKEAIDLARRTQPDVIMLDWTASQADALETCRRLRMDPLVGDVTPILLITPGGIGRNATLAALEAGTWELLPEPLDGETLFLKLRNYSQAKRAVDRVRGDQLLDIRTGMYTLPGLARRMREIGADAARRGGALTCIAFAPSTTDDGFAALEEDLIPEHVGRVCLSCGRASDVFGRLGHAEFAVIAPSTKRQGAEQLADRLRQRFADAPLKINGHTHALTLSLGLACTDDFSSASVDAGDFLLRAAQALRHARNTGRTSELLCYDQLPATALQ